jgi:FlaA1/EpsC-like NDP-sugar epimerase
MLRSLIVWLQVKSPLTKILSVALADLLVLTFAVLCAYALRVSDFQLPQWEKLPLYLVAPILSIISAGLAGVYKSAARSFSHDGERRLLYSQLVVPLVWAFLLLFLSAGGFARSVVVIYSVFAVLLMILMRRIAAAIFSMENSDSLPRREQVPVIIYGTGRHGIQLAETLKRQGRYRPVAFLDTDYTLLNRMVLGMRVYSIENLSHVLKKTRAPEIIIAKAGLSRSNRRVLVEKLLENGLLVKTIPDLDELLNEKFDVNAVRPIKLEDLLGRDPVPPDQFLMEKAVKGRIVLVTGAGGSIGSEIVRQVVSFAPTKIVMVDSNEFALFEIDREMESKFRGVENSPKLIPLLASILDETLIREIMEKQKIEVVFHAAAYKHVRMVQENAVAGIRNNVWGTKIVAEAARDLGVKLFVLISTDKAVRPTSIMGASKRVAELVVQALAKTKGVATIFTIVRFGNVLGSTGSVVPLFKEQIAQGGPVCVTDPNVTRYFMLIPEAAQLVIQAGAMAKGGEVFVLDMGEPVRIQDLAETMIELAGLTRKNGGNPNGDIEIVFTGLKDGEKMYEELQIGSNLTTTTHPRVMRCMEVMVTNSKLQAYLVALRRECDANNAEIAKTGLMRLALTNSAQVEAISQNELVREVPGH